MVNAMARPNCTWTDDYLDEIKCKNLLQLPNELLQCIFDTLPNRDLKTLRLTCRQFGVSAIPRLHRVFVSANPTDIQVLRQVADHDYFSKRVKEVIWDDARLLRKWLPDDPPVSLHDGQHKLIQGCPDWFIKERASNICTLNARKGFDVNRPDHVSRQKQVDGQMSPSDSWAYYRELLRQQEEVISTDGDVEAFNYALEHFPALRKVTITPAAHGFVFQPLYETPMIRRFPYGFNYPISRAWPSTGSGVETDAGHWARMSEEAKDQWRGFRKVTNLLAREDIAHQVKELVLDTHQLDTGLNSHLFDEPCREYDNIVNLVRRPGFRRLDIPLFIDKQEQLQWKSFPGPLLRQAISEARDLEHISLRTNIKANPGFRRKMVERAGEEPLETFRSLSTIFPADCWDRLRHFGLSGFVVTQDDLVSFLAALPSTLRSVDLSFLLFLDHGGGNYRGLLQDMRDKLGWRQRDPAERPRISIAVDLVLAKQGRAIWVSEETEAFVYGQGKNPFGLEDGRFPDQVHCGRAGIERDEFNLHHERPNALPADLRRLGIRK